MKRILLLICILFSVLIPNAFAYDYIVVNTNDGGGGSLRQAINDARANVNPGNGSPAVPHRVHFNIAGAAPYIINIGSPLDVNNQNITIDATTQPGWTAAQPVVIVRGNTGMIGFNVTGNTQTIKGFILQNLRVGVEITGGSNHIIQGCWLGIDYTGTSEATVSINEQGFYINNVQGTTIGGPAAGEGNVISGCLNSNDGNRRGAIQLGNGCYGTVINGNIIGLSAAGTSNANLGNGNNQPLHQHGIYMSGSSTVGTRVRIMNNVISNNKGNGVWIEGGYGGTVITGNKIGTDITGMFPMSNGGAGIRIDGLNNSNAHFIGVDELLVAGVGNRNIISGNGGATDVRNCRANAYNSGAGCAAQYLPGCDPTNNCPDRYDATLQCGIYLKDVSNTRIANNFVGTDATGNATIIATSLSPYNGLGNLYAGIKIEGSSTGNTIGGVTATLGNVIGGNGFDPFVTSGSTIPYLGHGIQLNNNSVRTTTVQNNFVGVGFDGVSLVGNRQDGISLLGSKNNTITNNTVGNNAWGIYLQSDFGGTGQANQASGNTISNNYVGTNAGGADLGNGSRTIPATDTEGGGIGMQHGSYSNTVSSNTVSFNRDGIVIKNSGNGGPAYQNTIQSNTVTTNVNSGILLALGAGGNALGTGNIIGGVGVGNTISSNGTYGIELDSAQSNKILTNAISLNTLDGINIHNGSRNNIIGGTSAEGNTIFTNAGNGIQIRNPNAAGSNLNAINRNSIYCNALRGIELNGAGNSNYAAPTFTGTPTNFSVTGGAWIELYTLDGCNTCPAGSTKLQGRTLVAEGAPGSAQLTNIDPATYGMTSNQDFTATTSSAAPSTSNGLTTAHNTSEFSVCVPLCVTPIPTAGSDQSVCAASATLGGNTPVSGTGVWTVVSGTASVTTPSSPTSAVTGLVVGSATLRWTITDGTCSAYDEVIITRDEVPTVANAGSDQNLCNLTTATLGGNTPTTGTGVWTVISGAANITTPSSPTSGLTGLAANGTATLVWTVSNGSCTVSTDEVVINTYTTPTAADAGLDQQVECNTTTTVLAGNTPAIGTGLWTIVSGTATIATPASATSSVTGLAANGTVTLRWTVSNGSCTASTDDVVINTYTTPTTSLAGTDQNLCSLTSTTLAGNTPAIGTGLWTVVSGTATITTPSSATSTVTGLAANGTVTLLWTISNGTCSASSDAVVINTYTTPTTANAGTDQSVCASNATLDGNMPTSGTGTWTVVSGGAIISNPSSPTSGVTDLIVGTTVLKWTIDNGSCAASEDEVSIVNSGSSIAADAGPDQEMCNGTSAILAANNAAPGIGTWTLISGIAIITTPNSPTSTVTGLGAGAITLRWSIINGACAANSDDVVINNFAIPTTANAGTDQEVVCNTTTTSLAGNVPSIGTGLWTVITGTATITTPTSPTSTLTGLASNGTVTLRWTVSNGTCTASSDDVVINTYTTPTTANAGPDQEVACNTTTTTLAGNTPTVGTGLWTVITGTATITNPTSATSTVTGLAANGTLTLRWTISNGTCTASSNDVVINTYTTPTTADAGPDQEVVCNTTTTTLAGNTPTIGTGLWTVITGTAIITSPSSPTSGVTGLAANGTLTLRWTISNGSCTASSNDVIINTYTTPTTANAGPDQEVACNTTTTTLAGNTPIVGTGLWTVISGTATITTPASATSTVTGLAANGAATLRWTISNGTCTASSNDVIINTYTTPTTANAGLDQNLCSLTSTTLGGNVPTVGTGLWTVITGQATITSLTSATSTVTGLAANGAATLRWTISNGTCTASSNDVIINTYTTPTIADAGPDQSVCASNATLAGNIVTSGTGTWTVISGGAIISNPTSPTSGVIDLIVGTTVLKWSVTNGSCAASEDEVSIVNSGSSIAANAGPDQNMCNLTSATLAGNDPAPGIGTWTLISGTATITSVNNPATTLTGLGTGAITLRWSIINGACAANTDEVIINNFAIPTTSDAGPDQDLCNLTTATLAGNTPTVGAGLWSVVSGTATITSPSSPTSTLTDLAANGTVTLAWTVSNGTCTESVDEVVINTFTTPTTANAGLDQEVPCNTTITTLAGNTPTVGTGLWTVVTGIATITTPTSATSGVTGLAANGTVTLRWTISNGTCTASSNDVIINTYTTPTTAVAGDDQDICSAMTATLVGNTPTIGTGLWEVVSGTATITTPSSPTSGVTGLAANGTATLSWTITNGTCSASADEVSINTYTNPTTADASADQSVCSSNAILSGNIPASGTGTWTVISGGATITTPNSPTSGVTDLIVGTTVLRWEITNGNCTASMDEVSIVNSGSSIAAVAGIDQDMCSETSATLAATDPAPGTGLWTVVSGSATITTPASPTTTLTGLGTGAITLRWSVSNGACTVSTDEVVINNYERPNTLSLTGPVNVCEGSTDITFTTTDIPGATYAWTYAGSSISGNGNSVTISFPTGTASGEVRVTATANGCEDLTPTSVMISVNPALSVDITAPGFNICQDDQVTLRATISGGSPTAEYDTIWVFDQFTQVFESLTVSTQGSYTVNLISNEPACGTASDIQIVTVTPKPTVAVAGVDRKICGTSLQLNANHPLVGTGRWEIVPGKGTGVFVDVDSNKTYVSGLSTGPNLFVWTISGACALPSRDTLEVNAANQSEVTVIAHAVQDTFCLGGIADITAEVSGTFAHATPYTFTWTSSDGSINLVTDDPNSSTVSVTPVATGWVTYYVNITDANGCSGDPSGQDQVYVVGQQALVVPNLITPNADNYNDCLIIRDVNEFDILPGSQFQLYNRWGQAVYKNNQYKNGDFCGSDLADGMYYYHLKTGCGENEIKGWLHIISNEASNK